MVYLSKHTGYGLVEVRDASTPGWYALFIDSRLIEQSQSYSHIVSQYNKY